MNKVHSFRFSPRVISVVVASLLSTGALAQTTDVGTSAKALGLSDYRHFVIYPHLEKALRAQQQNDEKTALTEFRHIHEQAPDNVPLTLYLAEAYRHFGHDGQAQQVLSEQLKRHPNDPRLLQQLAAIPQKVEVVNTVEQLQALQKRCDATPTTRCRSETGQYALKLGQLDIAQAQLTDSEFSQTPEGKDLEQGVLQRAIYLKDWRNADDIYSRRNQRGTLTAAQQQQWFDVLTAGQLDKRIEQLQSQGLMNSPEQQLAYASTLATRDKRDDLQRYLSNHRPRFDTTAQEQNWLYLISRYGQDPIPMMQSFDPRFAANRRFADGAAFPAAMKAGNYKQAQQFLDTVPADQMLNERYALSTATHNQAETLRVAGLMYQQSPSNLALLDTYSWQMMQSGQSRQAASLLLSRYPFNGSGTQADTLVTRLAELLQRYPDMLTDATRARLSRPLATATLRETQSRLLGSSADCQTTRALLGDLSPRYDAGSLSQLAECYRDDLPGMALYVQQLAERRHPDAYQHRAVAYKAYQVEDYATALTAWKKLPNDQLTNEDVMAAANTAQAAGDNTARDLWVDEARQRGLDNSEAWWWLHAQRYLPSQPEQAMSDLNQAIAITPTVRALTARAALHRQLKQDAAAVDDLRQALVLEPNDGATKAALGYALWSKGDYIASRDTLEQAQKSSPDDPQLIRQLMYVNERLGDIPQTQGYARQVVDELDANAQITPLTPAQNQERFDVRRLHEDIGRRWTINFDSSIGLNSNAMSPSGSQQNAPSSSQSYRSFGQLEAEYRLGRNMLLDGDMLSVYSRLFAGSGDSGVVLPVKNPMIGAGLRWKPLHDYTFFLALEEQFPLDRHHGEIDTMVRASASLFNNGKYSDEWHPNGNGWFAQNLYLDAAQYVHQDIQAWTADYRASWHQKVASQQTIEPYAHVQVNGYRDDHTQGTQLGGIGVRWNIWTGQTQYDAWPHKVSLGVEYQHTFKAINQDIDKRNSAFFTVGVHW